MFADSSAGAVSSKVFSKCSSYKHTSICILMRYRCIYIYIYICYDIYDICYYTGSRSVRLDIFTSLTYFVESTGRDKIQRRVKIYSSSK